MHKPSLILVAAVTSFALGCDGSVGTEDDQIVCSTQWNITGSAVLETKPAEISGCWPVGTWTFSLAQATNTCNPAPTPLGQYQIKVERDLAAEEPDHTYIYSYLTDPADMTATVSVTSGGGGLCEGELLVFSTDGKKIWNLHPSLNADNTIGGLGDYEEHTSSQIPSP